MKDESCDKNSGEGVAGDVIGHVELADVESTDPNDKDGEYDDDSVTETVTVPLRQDLRKYISSFPQWAVYIFCCFPRTILNERNNAEYWCRTNFDCSDLTIRSQPTPEAPRRFQILYLYVDCRRSKDVFSDRYKAPLRMLNQRLRSMNPERVNDARISFLTSDTASMSTATTAATSAATTASTTEVSSILSPVDPTPTHPTPSNSAAPATASASGPAPPRLDPQPRSQPDLTNVDESVPLLGHDSRTHQAWIFTLRNTFLEFVPHVPRARRSHSWPQPASQRV